jgi:transposase
LPGNLPIDGDSFRRVEVLTGAPRWRRWSAAEKAAIVAESWRPGAVASTVALRHGLHRNQLYMWRRDMWRRDMWRRDMWRRDMWRRELRSGALANAGAALPDFVPIVAENRSVSRIAAIEIEVGGAVLRADAGVDLAVLGKIIRLLKTI